MFRKMNNQQIYQSLFPMTNMGLYDQLKPVENFQVTITNNLENQPKVIEINTQKNNCCDDGLKGKYNFPEPPKTACCSLLGGCEECKCDDDTKCRCKEIKDFLEKLEMNY